MEEVEVEVIEDDAKIVHSRICANFETVERTLYDICTDLKTIRDNKYYKTLGYDTFESYCLDNFNLNRRTVYRYISVAENLSCDFVTSMSQNGVGVTKLDILSRLSDSERSELMENVGIEKMSVKELEQKSKKIKENRKVQDDIVELKENEPTLTKTNFKDVCTVNLENSTYYKGRFFTYDNLSIDNDLLSNYDYLTKTFNKLVNGEYDYLTKTFNKLVNGEYDYNNLDTLSDLIEVSRRLADCFYDLKQYLSRKK